MLIDRKLVEGMSGKRFANINPATEEVLGEVADADATDMARAIAPPGVRMTTRSGSTKSARR
jgi:aldehyde dehydrogenase (NAD+)